MSRVTCFLLITSLAVTGCSTENGTTAELSESVIAFSPSSWTSIRLPLQDAWAINDIMDLRLT